MVIKLKTISYPGCERLPSFLYKKPHALGTLLKIHASVTKITPTIASCNLIMTVLEMVMLLTSKFFKECSLAYLHKDDSVEGYIAPFAEVPCFLPVVPRMTSSKPDLFQHREYL